MTSVVAHAGQPLAPHDLWGAWPFEPTVLLLVAGSVALYGRGLRRLWSGEAGRRAVPPWRVACFAAAIVAVAVALLSPLEPLAGTLFSAHMAQHLLLTLVVPPLLVLGRPAVTVSMAFEAPTRRALTKVKDRVLPRPDRTVWWAVLAVVAHTATLWAWHVPPMYELALSNDLVHVVEHLTLVAGALPLWWLVAHARGGHANGAGVLAVFAALLQSGILAGLITFAGEGFYGGHAPGVENWGLTVLHDQQLAGGLMWFPGGLLYMVGGAALFLRWLREDEQTNAWQLTGRA